MLPGKVVITAELVAEAVIEAVTDVVAAVLLAMAILVETLELIIRVPVALRVAVWRVVGMEVTVELPKVPVAEAEADAVVLGVFLPSDPPAPAMRAGPGIGYSEST